MGLSKRLRRGDRTFTICGTRAYLAPEMINTVGKKGYTASVDFWQLGCFVYELVSTTVTVVVYMLLKL
jgi:serine/threonine protein kinase